MAWIALKRMVVGARGAERTVEPGDLVPEAETWPTRAAFVSDGAIRFDPSEPTQPPGGRTVRHDDKTRDDLPAARMAAAAGEAEERKRSVSVKVKPTSKKRRKS